MADSLVRFLDGRPALVLDDPDQLEHLAALLARVHSQALYRGGVPIPAVLDFVRSARRVVAIARLVPVAEPALDLDHLEGGRWVSTSHAAVALGITERAVRKRCESGHLEARRIAGRWAIDMKGLGGDGTQPLPAA
jgi:hypothetical protein